MIMIRLKGEPMWQDLATGVSLDEFFTQIEDMDQTYKIWIEIVPTWHRLKSHYVALDQIAEVKEVKELA